MKRPIFRYGAPADWLAFAALALFGIGVSWPVRAQDHRAPPGRRPRVRVTSRQPRAAGSRDRRTATRHDSLDMLAHALAAVPAPGNVDLRVLLAAARQGHPLPAIAWSMAHGHWALARALVASSSRDIPRWMRLDLALHGEDAGVIARLTAHPRTLSDGEIVGAYSRLGDYARAQTWALRAVREDPRNRIARRRYLHAVAVDASHVTVDGQWLSFSGYMYAGEDLRGRVYMRPDAGFLVHERVWWQHATSSSQLADIPASQQMGDVGFFVRRLHWRLQTAWGARDAWRRALTGFLSGRWEAGDVRVQGHVGLHRLSRQSPALTVAGMKNDAFAGITYRDSHWAGHLGGGWTAYQGQDGLTAGIDRYVRVGFYRSLHAGSWRCQIGPFADYHAVARSARVSGVLADSLEPSAQVPSSVLSGSRADYGISAFLGSVRPMLAVRWSPYLAASLYNSTRFGLQYQFSAGLRTPVRGPDQFSLVYSQGQGRNALAQMERMVKMSYTVYFS